MGRRRASRPSHSPRHQAPDDASSSSTARRARPGKRAAADPQPQQGCRPACRAHRGPQVHADTRRDEGLHEAFRHVRGPETRTDSWVHGVRRKPALIFHAHRSRRWSAHAANFCISAGADTCTLHFHLYERPVATVGDLRVSLRLCVALFHRSPMLFLSCPQDVRGGHWGRAQRGADIYVILPSPLLDRVMRKQPVFVTQSAFTAAVAHSRPASSAEHLTLFVSADCPSSGHPLLPLSRTRDARRCALLRSRSLRPSASADSR